MHDQRGISKKAFIQSFIILFVFMMIAGVLTKLIPAGNFSYVEVNGDQILDPDSYVETGKSDFPVWRWFTAPVEVLWSEDAPVILSIIIVILLIEGSFSVLDKTGIIRAVLSKITDKFDKRKYILLAVNVLLFMLFGALFGIFEEVIPIVTIMVPLAYALGWDALTGLGMSILATGFGFSAAIFNPFSIGIAQEIAALPALSGAPFRVLVFIAAYLLLTAFLIFHAKRIDKDPKKSITYEEDKPQRDHYYHHITAHEIAHEDKAGIKSGAKVFGISISFIVIAMVVISFTHINVPVFPLVGLMFLIGGIGAGYASGLGGKETWKTFGKGVLGVLPGAILILMAMSVKHIIKSAGVMDTLLFTISKGILTGSAFLGSVIIYGLTLIMNFFIGSASAKAFLIMPLITPLSDIIGVTRQTAVLAFAFGDGFSNMLYPTNPVLLIALSMTVVSYPKWLRFVIPVQILMLIVTIAFLGLATLTGYA